MFRFIFKLRIIFSFFRIILVVIILALIINVVTDFKPFIKLPQHSVHDYDLWDGDSFIMHKYTEEDRTLKGKIRSEYERLNEGDDEIKVESKVDFDDENTQDMTIVNTENDTYTNQSSGRAVGETDINVKEAGEDYFLTVENLKALSKINFMDKLKALNIVRKVRKEDLDRIICITRRGITYSEKGTVEDILKRSLSRKDIDKLQGILDKSKAVLLDN